jgi:hypothetical protein
MKRLSLPSQGKQSVRNDSSLLNFSALASSGYYFCLGCQHVTNRVQRGVHFVCVRCESPRVKYFPPVAV